jgi:hypothetical protein
MSLLTQVKSGAWKAPESKVGQDDVIGDPFHRLLMTRAVPISTVMQGWADPGWLESFIEG